MLEIEKKILELINNINYSFGLYFDDLNGNIIKYQENKLFETASTIKVFILAALYHEIYKGNLSKFEEIDYKKDLRVGGSGILKSMEEGIKMNLKNYAVLMISISDNVATNILIDKIGGVKKINSIIKKLGFEKTQLFNEINFEKYDKLGVTTPKEYATIFKMIYEENLFNPELSREMYSILRRQQSIERIAKYLPDFDVICRGTGEGKINSIATKSGSLSLSPCGGENVSNDGGIISTVKGDYIISMFASGFEDYMFYDDNESIEFEATISELIYSKFMKNEEKFKSKQIIKK